MGETRGKKRNEIPTTLKGLNNWIGVIADWIPRVSLQARPLVTFCKTFVRHRRGEVNEALVRGGRPNKFNGATDGQAVKASLRVKP